MNYSVLFHRVQFQLFTLLPLGIGMILLSLQYGCQQQQTPEPKKQIGAVTLENLQVAYARSVKNNRMYVLFSRQAEKEKLKNIASLYRAITRSEDIHAANHAALLRSHGAEPQMPQIDSITVGTTLQTLKMGLSSEEIEVGRMYPNLIQTAELEKFTDAKEQFDETKEGDARHIELMTEALNKGTKIQGVPYFVCKDCGYIITSDKTDECPVCHTKKASFEKITT